MFEVKVKRGTVKARAASETLTFVRIERHGDIIVYGDLDLKENRDAYMNRLRELAYWNYSPRRRFAGRRQSQEKENRAMSEEKTRIEVQYSTDGLFGATDPNDYDEKASITQFGEALTNRLYEAYPKAEITVMASIIDSVRVNGRADHDEAELIIPIVEKVWNGDDWLVGK